MIDEAMGKILGMAMAYFVSGLGLLLAYINYRRRTVKAEKVMSGTAWAVVALVVLATAGATALVFRLADASAAAAETASASTEPVADSAIDPTQPTMEPVAPRSGDPATRERERWPLVGILFPAAVFLLATWLTAALHRHFSRPPSPDDGATGADSQRMRTPHG